jgi:hypothetical protein
VYVNKRLAAQMRKIRTPEQTDHRSFFDSSIDNNIGFSQEVAVSGIRTQGYNIYDIT